MSFPTIAYDDLPLWSAPFGLALLDTVRMQSHVNVLDIGSGSGFPMLELAGRLGKSCMVYGLEPDEEAIAMITAKKEAREIVLARIVKGVAEEIPFPDGYFGLIVSNNGLNNVTDQARALSECYRVADDGAQMVLTVNLPHTMFEFYGVYEKVLLEMGLNNEVVKMHEHIHEKRRPVEFLRDLIEASGFAIRSISIDGFKMKYADGAAFLGHYFIRKAFRGPWEEFLPDGIAQAVFAKIEEKLDAIALENGELVMSVPFACFDCVKTKTT